MVILSKHVLMMVAVMKFEASCSTIVGLFLSVLFVYYGFNVTSMLNVPSVSVLYINKYIDKGGDRSTMTLHNQYDEVKQYIDGRNFSASEAAW